MAEQSVVFAFSIGEKVISNLTGRDAWVVGLMVGADGLAQYNLNTTKVSGESIQVWVRVNDIDAIAAE